MKLQLVYIKDACSALIVLVGRYEENLSHGMLVGLSVWNEVHVVCIRFSQCPCHPKTPSLLASLKSRMVLSFWRKDKAACWGQCFLFYSVF